MFAAAVNDSEILGVWKIIMSYFLFQFLGSVLSCPKKAILKGHSLVVII